MRNLDETTITQAVLATHRSAANGRLSEVMTSLVQHLHAFARDIKLTEQEWQDGVAFLEQVGQAGSANHSEFALLSHVLGLTTLVLAQNTTRLAECTLPAALDNRAPPQGTVYDLGANISADQSGPMGWVQGTVRDTQGGPVPFATVQVMASGPTCTTPALLQADAQGCFRFSCALPKSQQVAAAGPVTALLSALDRPAWRPAHLTFLISAAGYRPLTTLIFLEGDPHLAADALFGVRASLIAEWKHHPAGTTPDGTVATEPFFTLSFDFVVALA
jgi:hydroxyquinol 1,2-dioxygenase